MRGVSLPMYDFPQVRESTTRILNLLVETLCGAGEDVEVVFPENTAHHNLIEHWESPDTYLSQSCGLPFVEHLYEYVDVIGTLASGWLTDRYDPRRLLAAYYLLRGISLFVLDPALAQGGSGLFGFMAFYGLDWVATVPPTIALCLQHFGSERGPLVYGWVFAGHQVGGALAAWGAGALHDVSGSYRPSFVLAGVACVVAAVGVGRIVRSAPDSPARIGGVAS